ncbi:MAG TPA: hypothetical protein VLW50_28680 [Streptosporangiaceae bacterium]|nr:hypothetical protein [Streptosporangiaceae bacterium]
MRLTSATDKRAIAADADASALVPRSAIWSRTNRAALPGLVALLGAVCFVIARLQTWAHGDISAFIMLGNHYANAAQLPKGVRLRATYGYDGQFFYRLALDPANLNHTAFGITMDQPYRYTRIGYPALTWLISLGQHQFVPVALVVVNIAATAGLGVLGGLFARQSGRHALWGLLMPAYFGLLTSLGRDTAEPLAAVCLLGGMLAYRRRRPVLAAAAFAYGALTRETVLVVPAAIAITRLAQMARRRARPGTDDLTWVVPVTIFAGWQLVVLAATGSLPLFADRNRNVGTPFAAAIHAVLYNFGHVVTNHPRQLDAWLLEFTILVILAVAALLSLRATTAPAHERLAFVFSLVEVCVLTPTIWSSYVADFRSFIEVYLLALIILLAAPLRHLTTFRRPALLAADLPLGRAAPGHRRAKEGRAEEDRGEDEDIDGGDGPMRRDPPGDPQRRGRVLR